MAIPTYSAAISGPITTTSAAFTDVTGASISVTLPTAATIIAMFPFEAQTTGGGTDANGRFAVRVHTTYGEYYERYFSGTNDLGLGCAMARVEMAAGTYDVKARWMRVSGTKTLQLNNAELIVFTDESDQLSFEPTLMERPSKETLGADGNFSGVEASPPILITGKVNVGRWHREITLECDDSGVIAEWVTGSATTLLDAWVQTWVDANLVNTIGGLGTKYDDTNLTAAQRSYLNTKLTVTP